MKIEVDLLEISQDQDSEKMARVCAVALLSALPRDVAELAIWEWEAVQKVRQADAAMYPTPASAAESGTAAADASTAGDGPLPDMQAHVEHPGLTAPRRAPDYKVGGWVVTDLGELAKIAGIKDQTPGPGRVLKVEVDYGEQNPTQKIVNVDRVHPATAAEVAAGAAREAMVTTTPDSQPVQDVGEKKKRGPGRPKKVAQEPAQPESNSEAMEAAAAVAPVIKAGKYDGTSLNDLCRLAVAHTKPGVVAALFEARGNKFIKNMTPAEQAGLRAAVLELVP